MRAVGDGAWGIVSRVGWASGIGWGGGGCRRVPTSSGLGVGKGARMRHEVRLERDGVLLRPLRPEDAEVLHPHLDERMWAGMSAPLPPSPEALAEEFCALINRPDCLAFAVEEEGRVLGRTTFYDLVPGLRTEIGSTVYLRSAWGTRVNPVCKLLLFKHAFEELDVGRAALRCDHRNLRSHRAIARLGARFEGTLRGYRRAADGTVADVDYFSVLRAEWPRVRDGLERRLAG